MKDLKEKAIRGGAARVCAQAANFALRLLSLMVLARLLDPKDFGLVGMVTAFTGLLGLFRDFGLSAATIQRGTITEEQLSSLFWINLVAGVALGLACLALAPAIAVFYHEPRLLGVTVVLAAGFLFNAAGVQHGAILQRQMRFTALAVINTAALALSAGLAIGGARAGYGYWSLVAMAVTLPFFTSAGFWLTAGWVPGLPRRHSGIRSLVRFGGLISLNSVVVYIASNSEKILLGRYWGVDALGLYGRAYQLINIPTENLNSAAGEVAFSALSRLQNEPARLRNYFLKGYSLVLAMTLPLTIGCAFFAGDLVLVILGPKWTAAAPIFRLLAPTILVFATLNPLSWLLPAIGMVGRLLRIGLAVAPVMIASYILGLPYGPRGVALAYSVAMLGWLLPAAAWAVHGTAVSVRDLFKTMAGPLFASVLAGGVALGVRAAYGHSLAPLPRLLLEGTTLLLTFAVAVFFLSGQKELYKELFRTLRRAPAPQDKAVVSI